MAAIHDCKNCASFLPKDKTATVFPGNTGCDVCLQFGHILSNPKNTDAANDRIRIEFANVCPKRDDPRPEHLPAHLQATVALPDPEVMKRIKLRAGEEIPADMRPITCNACMHYVPPQVMAKEIGWLQGGCAAWGRLLSPTRLETEARNCTEGEAGPNRDTTDGMMLLPQYQATGGTISMSGPRNVPTMVLEPLKDPRDYDTDKPVSAADRLTGIRGWRAIPDPEGIHDPVYWPIFDWVEVARKEAKEIHGLTGLTERDLRELDPRLSYANHKPELYMDHGGIFYDAVCELMEHECVPSLIGPAGAGKTEMACALARAADMRFSLIPLRDDTETYEFVGEKNLEEGVHGPITTFVPGFFTADLSRIGLTLLDEINLAPEAVFHYLRPILLGATRLEVPQANVTIQKHYWRFLMTAMNPSWDPRYIGTKPLAAPDFERVLKIAVDIPPDAIEREIIRTHCRAAGYTLPEQTLDTIMQIAGDLRQFSQNGSIPVAWGIRPQVMVALRTRTYSLAKAYRRVATDGFEEAAAKLVLGAVEQYTNGAPF